ncbi:alpha-N-acetylgalactosamine-specific lectin-like [Branchiostoma floridae x Branchiostoma belcheri]
MYKPLQGICYKEFGTYKTFNDAATTCRQDGGTLAMPRDSATNLSLLDKSVDPIHGQWIGLNDQREEGNYEWADGTPLGDYNAWAPGQPDNYQDKEDCIHRHPLTGEWNDIPCHLPLPFVCQIVAGST